MPSTSDIDVAIIGAGAAGLATAIFTRRLNPDAAVVLFEGAPKPGAKILVSGGSRCNVTNTVVTERDFNGGRPAIVRRILRALPVEDTVAFFREIGVPLHEEAGGKLFPNSNRSHDVRDALLRAVEQTGSTLRAGHRVVGVTAEAGSFRVETNHGAVRSRAIVLATGGLSLPKTGSDGWGYNVARALGHSIVETTPALAPLVLDDQPSSIHRTLAGVAQPVRIDVRVDGSIATSITGPMLWTHFGISGPAALDVSRHLLRARIEGREVTLTASLCPSERFESLEAAWTAATKDRPRSTMQTMVAQLMPASVAAAILQSAGIPEQRTMAELTRAERRTVAHALTAWPLNVRDSRGYSYAEVTAGGVALTEIDPATMGSRLCRGLFLVGEILDVDGRLGGFNFQWAWSSARVAAEGLRSFLTQTS